MRGKIHEQCLGILAHRKSKPCRVELADDAATLLPGGRPDRFLLGHGVINDFKSQLAQNSAAKFLWFCHPSIGQVHLLFIYVVPKICVLVPVTKGVMRFGELVKNAPTSAFSDVRRVVSS